MLSLNEFYGFPPAFVRPAGPFGPFTFDISCHYDPDTNRWFHLAVDLDQDPATGDFTGKNYLDLAVSHSGDPTGTWSVYRIPGVNDGTEGTPDHNCDGGPCFADFPHIGSGQVRRLHHDERVPALRGRLHRGAGVRDLEEAARLALTVHHRAPVQHGGRPGSPG